MRASVVKRHPAAATSGSTALTLRFTPIKTWPVSLQNQLPQTDQALTMADHVLMSLVQHNLQTP
jgi:hypothetical protein